MAANWISPLLLVTTAALSQPVARRLGPAVSATALQLVAGVLLGPSLLGLVHITVSVRVLSALGMSYLLFVSGAELPPGLKLNRQGQQAVSSAGTGLLTAGGLALLIAKGLDVLDWPTTFVTLSATLVLPTVVGLQGAVGELRAWAQRTVLTAALGDLLAAVLICVWSLRAHIVGAAGVIAILAASVIGGRRVAASATTVGRRLRFDGARVVLAWFGIVVAAAGVVPLGPETVIAAMGAGLLFAAYQGGRQGAQRGPAATDRIGLVALAPMSFVAAGARINLSLALGSTRGIALAAVLVGAVLVTKLVPATLTGVRQVGTARALGAGFLLSTKLTLVVVEVQLAMATGSLSRADASTVLVVCAFSVCVFPLVAEALVFGRQRRSNDDARERLAEPASEAVFPPPQEAKAPWVELAARPSQRRCGPQCLSRSTPPAPGVTGSNASGLSPTAPGCKV